MDVMSKISERELLAMLEDVTGVKPDKVQLRSIPRIDTHNYFLPAALTVKNAAKLADKIEKRATSKGELKLVEELRNATEEDLKVLTESGYALNLAELEQLDLVRKKLAGSEYTAVLREKIRKGLGVYNQFSLDNEISYVCVVVKKKGAGDMVRFLGIENCANFGISRELIARQLDKWDKKLGLEVFEVTHDTLHFGISKLPSNLSAFIKQVLKICPEYGGFDSDIKRDRVAFEKFLKTAAKDLRINKRVFCWWD